MSCAEFEKSIYTFQEISGEEQEKVKQHVKTCERCQKLFAEVEGFSQIIKKVAGESQSHSHFDLVEKVMSGIRSEKKVSNNRQFSSFLDLSISRFALAAVSCGILVLFFIEILVPDLQSGKIKGPISNIQGAIIKSEDFRKTFTRPKEKKSIFDDCKKNLSNQVDANCVKEKLSKINL